MVSTIDTTKDNAQPTDRLVAKLRRRQLDLAQKGCIVESAQIADRVDRIRQEILVPANR